VHTRGISPAGFFFLLFVTPGALGMLLGRTAIALGAVLSAVPACGIFSQRTPSPARSEVSVEVESHNWSDITVYLMAGGLPQRLGMVTALRTATFVFSSQRLNFGSGIRLRALPVAGGAFTTETILVQPGQSIFWTLENDLDASSLTVY
jgi:hypothetical protein